ncbi:MAG TPA: serine hydrolase domain-containing protein [Xanthobacteraceae bacterium]
MPSEDRARIDRVIADLRPQGPIRPPQRSIRTLGDRMHELGTPGASVAVIENFEVAWASGFGVRNVGEHAAVQPDTAFQAGSISKPVFALAVMRLCQDKRIDLDADIRTYLKSWRMPEGDDGWAPRVNFRQLLSHTAGTTVHGFPGYPAGGSWPSLTQVLDGAPPANTPPIFVDLIPGMQFRYSGGGTTIAQLAVTDLVGLAFPDLMRELVLAPLGMEDSSYEQPPSSTLAGRAAVGHPLNGVPTPDGWHVYPEMAAAGLWTTAGDLAHLGAALMRGLRGEITGLGLSQESLAAMLRPQLPDQTKGSEFVGLAWFCAGDGDAFRFGHAGGNHGFLANLRLYPATGQGAAVMINSNQGWPLIEELLASIEREYRWPSIAQATSDTSIAAQLAGTYRDSADRVFRIEEAGAKLLLRVGDQAPIRLTPSSNGVLSAQIPQIKVRLAPTSEGSPAITLTQGGRTFEAIKVPEEAHG